METRKKGGTWYKLVWATKKQFSPKRKKSIAKNINNPGIRNRSYICSG